MSLFSSRLRIGPALRAGVRQRPAVFRALGNRDLPETVVIQGREFHRLDTFKHDSWAATGLYRGAGQLAICKFNRQQSIGGLPMRWLGRLLGSRERKFLQRLAGIEGIPADLGEVTVAGRVQTSVVAREFIPGEILSAAKALPVDFFERLRHLLKAVHRQGVAYVDLHKPENVLVSEDGRPYLFDFQISYAVPRGLVGKLPPLRWWLHCLQRSDDYHLLKHELQSGAGDTRERLEEARPWWIKLHRLVAVPFRTFRRNLLVTLGVRSGHGSARTEAQPEVAFRSSH